jgi:hypothetical protein
VARGIAAPSPPPELAWRDVQDIGAPAAVTP